MEDVAHLRVENLAVPQGADVEEVARIQAAFRPDHQQSCGGTRLGSPPPDSNNGGGRRFALGPMDPELLFTSF